MRGTQAPGRGQIRHEPLQRALRRQIQRRRDAAHQPVRHLQVLAAAERPARRSEQHHHRPRLAERAADHPPGVLYYAHHAEHRGRQDRPAVRLVVEADVAAGDRDLQRPARIADPRHRAGELPHDLRPLRISEVQAVGGADRPSAGAGDVAGRLRHGQHRPAVRVEKAVPPVAVDRERQGARRALDAHHPGPGPGRRDGVGPHHVVVLAVDPAPARDAGRADEPQEDLGRGAGRRQRRHVERLPCAQIRRLAARTIVERRLVGQRPVRDLRHDPAAVAHAQQAVAGHFADPDRVQIPLLEHPVDLRLASSPHDEQHPLLRLGQHDLVRGHARLAPRHAGDVDVDAGAAAGAHLARRAGQPGRPHVLQTYQGVRPQHLQARLEQQLLQERITHLHVGPFPGRRVVELGRRHRRAVDAVAAGLRADVVDGVARPLRAAPDHALHRRDAQAEDVDQRVAGIGLVEGDLPADGRNPDAVAVAGDPRHHPLDQPPGRGRIGRSEP